MRKGNQAQIDRAWGGALVLLILVLLLFVAARFTAVRSARRLGRR
jgi:ABC-type phosphate transport system permease subunit